MISNLSRFEGIWPYIFVSDFLGPVVRMPDSANPELHFNMSYQNTLLDNFLYSF